MLELPRFGREVASARALTEMSTPSAAMSIRR